MTNNDEQQDRHDELLSAYLDNELAPDERAAVEARLATDPAAQQLLEQLRMVSTAVRAMPRESLNQDLCESVLKRVQPERAEDQVVQSARRVPVAVTNSVSLPRFTVGRTLRGWVWASLAIAAALLIMVFQPDDRRNEGLPSLAQREDQNLMTRELARGDATTPTRDQPPQRIESRESSSQDADATLGSRLAVRGRTDHGGTAAVAPSAHPGAEPQPLRESVSLAKSREAQAGADRSTPRDELGDELDSVDASRPLSNEEPLVVVHVVTKRDALQRKTFDQLLARNGIVMETDPPSPPPTLPSDAAAPGTPPAGSAPGQASRGETDESQTVIVEAPPEAIFSCLSDLNQDKENYAGVLVDDVQSRESAPAGTPGNEKLAENLGLTQFTRGKVPTTKVQSLSAKSYVYTGEAQPWAEHSSLPPTTNSDDRPSSRTTKWTPGAEQEPGVAIQGRARRFVAREEAANPEAKVTREVSQWGAPTAGDSQKLLEIERALKSAARSYPSNLQVLFFLSADDAATSSPETADRAE
jgi:negative regulator of sigma E activity